MRENDGELQSIRGWQFMFTSEERRDVLARILTLVKEDHRLVAGALIGSMAGQQEDRWSDIDITFGVADGHALETVLDDWTTRLDQEFGVLHYFDLRSGSSIYRVFLLSSGLEIDFSVTPEHDFGAYNARFQLLFGQAKSFGRSVPLTPQHLIGLGWHHVFHAHACIEREKLWEAEYLISALRDHVLALACIRLGEDAVYARGVDRLPSEVVDPLRAALVCSLEREELRRALAVAARCLITEIEQQDRAFADQCQRFVRELGIVVS